jgi:hypothetical protein
MQSMHIYVFISFHIGWLSPTGYHWMEFLAYLPMLSGHRQAHAQWRASKKSALDYAHAMAT